MSSEREREQAQEEVAKSAEAADADTPSASGAGEVAETETGAWLPMSDEHRWGESISTERQAELDGYLQQWDEAERTGAGHGEREGNFANVRLTGADVYYLATRALAGGLAAAQARLRNAAERFSLDLSALHLEGADLTEAHLEGAVLAQAHLEGADLFGAHLKQAVLTEAHLEGASLLGAHLKRAVLTGASLEGAGLISASLEGARLEGAHLEGVDLARAHLEGANLDGAWLDSKTVVSNAMLDDTTRLGDIQWSGVGAVNLTRINWERVPRLGDEQRIGRRADVERHEAVVRAYRQLAAQLRAQGMSEVADRFLHRAQVRQRRLLWRQGKLGSYLFSLLLAGLAGYGYRLGRILVAYALIVGVFAAAFLVSDVVSGQAPLTIPQAFDAMQVSLNAVHGRVFFAQFHLDTLQSWLATGESIVGIVVEGVFVAMLIQRFFGR